MLNSKISYIITLFNTCPNCYVLYIYIYISYNVTKLNSTVPLPYNIRVFLFNYEHIR